MARRRGPSANPSNRETAWSRRAAQTKSASRSSTSAAPTKGFGIRWDFPGDFGFDFGFDFDFDFDFADEAAASGAFLDAAGPRMAWVAQSSARADCLRGGKGGGVVAEGTGGCASGFGSSGGFAFGEGKGSFGVTRWRPSTTVNSCSAGPPARAPGTFIGTVGRSTFASRS